MKIALVQAPVWWTVDPPLGLAQIAGCLKSHGHEAVVFDLNMLLWKERLKKYESLWIWEQSHFWNQPEFVARFFKDNSLSIGRHVESILRQNAPIVGFSVYSGTHLATLELARLVKTADSRRKIVLGGQYFFFGDKIKEMLSDPCVDAVVSGEGDEVFPELIKRYEASGALEPLPGVWVKAPEGSAVSGGAPEFVKSLDAVPFADFTGFPMEIYGDLERVPIAASRGCVWQCRFCSARAFWKGYRYMSGERIFAEVVHHRKLYPPRGHFEFYDITANGDVRALHQFSRLLSDAVSARPELSMGWKINAIIRPEMTPEVLRDLRRANCHDIIYGIESGSPRVLKAMNKGYVVPTAERVLKDTHDAGIVTVGNFMFGFPGETEADFGQTLDFLRRNKKSFDRVYASATFTSLEEKSYLKDHQDEFGIQEVSPERFHNLYWETKDGTNTYPVRLDRYKRFRALAISLGIDAYKGVNGVLEQDHLANLAQYNHHSGKPLSAICNHLEYLEMDVYHEPTRRQLLGQKETLARLVRVAKLLDKADRLAQTLPDAASRALNRAREQLALLDGESVRIEYQEGRFVLFWSQEAMPPFKAMSAVLSRMRLILDLVESEMRSGEDKKPEPVCAR
ncbi:MAG: B12-binding domain-containing radical SAM protein [Elusimicrobiota bacterium]